MENIKYHATDGGVFIEGVRDFNPTHTFGCGQCFRWDAESDGSYTGVAFSRAVNISASDGRIFILGATVDDAKNIWTDYLDLGRDYSMIKKELLHDENVRRAIEFGAGIRILNQEKFECLVSYIISTQNAIPRIKKIVSKLCGMYGDKIEFSGRTYYSFPTPAQLEGVSADDLEPLHAGYRAAYIADAVQKVCSGDVDLDRVSALDTAAARKELLKIKGVGPKVADCTMLFSMKKSDAFPIDVWVQRTMRTLYCGEGANLNMIQAKAAQIFGEYAGIAQQYLFYYARENAMKR